MTDHRPLFRLLLTSVALVLSFLAEARAGLSTPMDLRLDERTVRDAMVTAWKLELEVQAEKALAHAVGGAIGAAIVSKIEVELPELYGSTEFSSDGSKNGVQIKVDTPIEVSFLPLGFRLAQRVHALGRISIQGSLTLNTQGDLVWVGRAARGQLRLQCHALWPKPLCDLARQIVDDRVSQGLKSALAALSGKDLVILKGGVIAPVFEATSETARLVLVSIQYQEPECATIQPADLLTLKSGWIDLRVAIQTP